MNIKYWLFFPLILSSIPAMAEMPNPPVGKAATPTMKTTEFSLAHNQATAQLSDKEVMALAEQAVKQQRWQDAFDLILPLAQKGDLLAQTNIGLFYLQGRGVAQDLDKAYWWLSEAAERGSVKALNNLGLMYLEGYGVRKSVPHAIKLFTLSAKSDNPRSAYILGLVYYKELADFKNALTWFQRAATLGDSEAGFNLGYMYESGKGTPVDIKKAIHWYQNSLDNQPHFNAEFQAKVKAKIAELKALAKDH